MRFVLIFGLSCALAINQALLAAEQAVVTLDGSGKVVKATDIEIIHAEGRVGGYIAGTFLWEEQHELAPEPEQALEKGRIFIIDKNGDTMILNFSGRAAMNPTGETVLEGAEGKFTYQEGTGRWEKQPLSGTYTKAGVFKNDSVELSVTLTIKGE
jgi:hypothetical protein